MQFRSTARLVGRWQWLYTAAVRSISLASQPAACIGST